MSYVKQNWKTGDTITATKMNNMDNAISVNDSAISVLNENKLNKPTNTGIEGQIIVKGTGDTVRFEDMPTANTTTIKIGTVTTGEAGTQASVTNSGTDTNVVLDMVIPKGEKGDKGEAGGDIDTSNFATLADDNTFSGTNTFSNPVSVASPTSDNHAVNKGYLASATVENATKAERDSDGNIIKDTYFNIKTGIVNDGYIASGEHTFRIKNQSANTASGSGFILQSDRVGIYNWNLNKYILSSLNSGKGYVQGNTPPIETSDGTMATCNFVKSQSASMQVSTLDTDYNYWIKEPSGLVIQYAELDANTQEIDVPLPISFPNKCLFVGVEILNTEKDVSKNVDFNIIEKNVDSIKLLKIGTGNPTIIVRAEGI